MSQKSSMLALAGKRAYDFVEFPEPIGRVHMRTLSSGESITCANFQYDDNGKPVPGREKYTNAKRLSFAIVNSDTDRNPMYDESDLEAMSEWPETFKNALLKKYWEMANADYVPTFLKNVTPAA